MSNKIQEDVEKIIRYPIRSHIKISNKDVRLLSSQLTHMSLNEMKSLREFLTVVPAIAKKRIEMGFNENKKFGSFTVVRDTPHSKVLLEQYGTDEPKLTLKANIN